MPQRYTPPKPKPRPKQRAPQTPLKGSSPVTPPGGNAPSTPQRPLAPPAPKQAGVPQPLHPSARMAMLQGRVFTPQRPQPSRFPPAPPIPGGGPQMATPAPVEGRPQRSVPRVPRPPPPAVQQQVTEPPSGQFSQWLDQHGYDTKNRRFIPPSYEENDILQGLEKLGAAEPLRDISAEVLNRVGRWATAAHERIYAPEYQQYEPPTGGAVRSGKGGGFVEPKTGQVTSIVDVTPDPKKGLISGTDYVIVRPDGQSEFAPRTRVTEPTVLRRAGRMAQEGVMGLLQGTLGVVAEAAERTIMGPVSRKGPMTFVPVELPMPDGGTITYQPPLNPDGLTTNETLETAAYRMFGNTPEVEEALAATDRIAYSGQPNRLRAVARILNGEDVEEVLYGNGGYVMDKLMDLGFAEDPLAAIKADPKTLYYYNRRKAELESGEQLRTSDDPVLPTPVMRSLTPQEIDDQIVQEIATQGLPGEHNPWLEMAGQTLFDPTNFVGGFMDEAVEATRVANTRKWFGNPMELDAALSLMSKEYQPALKLGSRTLPLDWMPHVRTPSAALARTANLAADGMNASAMVIAENAAKLAPKARQAHILAQLQAYVDLTAPAPKLADFQKAAEAAESIAPQLLKATPEELLAEATTRWQLKRQLAQTALGNVDVAHSGAGQLGSAVMRQLITDDSGKISKKLTEAITSGKPSGEVLEEVMNGLNDATLNLLQPARRGAKSIKEFVELGGKAEDFPIFERGLAGQVERWTVHKAAGEAGLKYPVSPVTRAIAGSNFIRRHIDNGLWTVFARMSRSYTIRNALNAVTTAIVDKKLGMVSGAEIDALEAITAFPMRAESGIGQGVQFGQGQEGFWKGGFAGEFKIGNVPIGAQAVEREFSRRIWYEGAKQFLDRQMYLGKAIPNLPAGVRLKIGEDAARQFVQMTARNYGNPAEAMEWLSKRLGGEAEVYRILDDEDFRLLQQHDPKLAKKVQTLLHKASDENALRQGFAGLRGQTATKLKQIDDAIPPIIDPDDPQWIGVAEDAKLADASGVQVPVDDFNKRVSAQREYMDAARGNALDSVKTTGQPDNFKRFIDTEKNVSAESLRTRKAHDALRDRVRREDSLIRSTVKSGTQRQILLDNLWGDYFAERDELWTNFRHTATDTWDKLRYEMAGMEYVPRTYPDAPLRKTISATDPYSPTSNPVLNTQILRQYAAQGFDEFQIYTATKTGAPNDAQLLNALNYKDYRLAAGLNDIPLFTREELRRGLTAERLEQAESILSNRYAVKLAGGQLPPNVMAEAAFRASPEAAQAQLAAAREAQGFSNVPMRDLRRLFNPDGTAKAWAENNPGKWLEQAGEMFSKAGVEAPPDAGREFFEGLAQSQMRNVAAEKGLRQVAGPAPRLRQSVFPGAIPEVRQGPPVVGLGEPGAVEVGGELPGIPPRPTPQVHIPPNDPHSLTPLLRRVEQKALSKWGQKVPISIGQDDWRLMQAWAEQATRQGQEARIIAGQVGSQARDFALLNYADRRNIDQWLSVVYPYHYWYTRTMGNWAKRMVINPGAMATYGRYRTMLERMHGALPEYWRQQLSTEDLGLPLEHPLMFNLEQTMSPLYGLLGEDYSDEKRRRAELAGIDNAGALIEDMNQFGPSLWAPITWAMVASNARSDPEAAMAWGNNYLGQTAREVRALTALAGEAGVSGIPAGGLNLDPQMIMTNMAVGNGLSTQNMTQWERDSLATQFMTLYSSPPPPGVNEQDWKAQVMQQGYSESGPLFDQMLQKLMVSTSPSVLTAANFGLGFKGRGTEQVEIANIWAELASIRSHYDDWTPEQIALAYNDLEERHPGYDTMVLLRASGPQRDDQWIWEAISRVGIGYSDAWKAAGVSQAAWDEFYKLKTTGAMNPALREELLMGVNAVNSIARPTTVEEARRQIEARNTYKEIDAQLHGEFDADTFALQDEYFQVRDAQGPDAGDEFLAALPPDSSLYALWDRRTELLAADPDASRYYLDPERYKSYLTSQWYDTQDPQLVEAARLRKEYKDNGDFRAVEAIDKRYPGLKQFYAERDAFYDALPGEVADWLDTLPEAEQFQLREDVTPTTQLQKNLAGVKAKEEAMFAPQLEGMEEEPPSKAGQTLSLREQIESEVAAQMDVETKKNGYLTGDNRDIYETTLYNAITSAAGGDPELAEAMFKQVHQQGWQVYQTLNSPDELIAYMGSAGTGQLREKLLTDTSSKWTSALAYVRTLSPEEVQQLKRTIPDLEAVWQHAQKWDYGPSEEARADVVGLKVSFNLDGSVSLSRLSNKKYYGEAEGGEVAYAPSGSYSAGVGSSPTRPPRKRGKKTPSTFTEGVEGVGVPSPEDVFTPRRRGGGRGRSGRPSGEGAYAPPAADVGAWTSFVQAMGNTPLLITRLSDYFDSDSFTRNAMLQRFPDLAALIQRLKPEELSRLEAAYFAWAGTRNRPQSRRRGRNRSVSLRVYQRRGERSGL